VEQYLTSGKVVPVIDQVFPLEQAAEAFAMLERGGTVGKIVITVGNVS
jgi:NADPH:quinone reductase-like Zn-dependent oxidoreductase